MAQIGESASPAMIADIKHDDECYFCNAKDEPKKEENVTEDDPDDDSEFPGLEEEGVKFKNDASALGRALGGSPGKKKAPVAGAGSFDSSTAAHHLVPGKASLKQSKFFLEKKYIWTEGAAKGNVGYNVNSAPNGEWLPGNYAQRPWGTKGAAFAAKARVSAQDYAFASIDTWEHQFHDSHEDYSIVVKQALDQVFDKLEHNETIVCPEAAKKKKDKPEEKSPLYLLVSRFHTISGRMRRMLKFPVENWFRNVFTSGFSLLYMNKVSPPKKRKR
jgi:A nuclease family of the HNH/ENDO VII superfamily with conserved AHH